jgi:hypothetical protein
MYVYQLAPINLWGGWSKPENVISDDPHDADRIHRAEFETFFERAKVVAQRIGWEGDMRQGPYVSGLADPTAAQHLFMIGWKQGSSGTTFIASPVPLVHLEKIGYRPTRG